MSDTHLLSSISKTSSLEDWSDLDLPSIDQREKCVPQLRSRRVSSRLSTLLVAATVATGFVVAVSSCFWQSVTSCESVTSLYMGDEEQCVKVAPFVFDSVHALTKQWPSTYAPNGHSFVPVIMPRGTPLYHTAQYLGEVEVPTWLSFDPEMGLGIFSSSGPAYEYTFITTKPLYLVYIDGQGAVLSSMGTLDSQTAVLRGRVELHPNNDFIYNETQRGIELCQQASEMKIDGFMRMNAGFEVLICNRIAVGLKQFAVTNVTVPGIGSARDTDENPELPEDPDRLPPYGYGNVYAPQNNFEWVRSATWHYGGYGAASSNLRETRVSIDFCGFVSFYDPRLTSLRDSHHGGLRPGEVWEMGWGLRRGHRLLDVSHSDAQIVVEWVHGATKARRDHGLLIGDHRGASEGCSGTNWQATTEVITTQHKSRAKEIAGALSQVGIWSDEKVLDRVHALSHAILHPFVVYPSTEGLSLVDTKSKAITECSTLYTNHLTETSHNEFEALIRNSIEIVLNRICSWEWELFEWSENRTTNLFGDVQAATNKDLHAEIEIYQDKSAALLEYMGWDLWDGCDQPCSWDEVCYIPMWPVVYSPGKHQGGPWGGSTYTKDEEIEFWKPKCVSLEAYDKWGGRARDPEHQMPDTPWINETYRRI